MTAAGFESHYRRYLPRSQYHGRSCEEEEEEEELFVFMCQRVVESE